MMMLRRSHTFFVLVKLPSNFMMGFTGVLKSFERLLNLCMTLMLEGVLKSDAIQKL